MKNNLTARDALHIAGQYGFSIRASNWERQMIRDGIILAREAHEGPRYDGAKRKTALQYFDEYIARMADEIREDSKAYGVPVRRLGLIG
jgi:hypothetical protein